MPRSKPATSQARRMLILYKQPFTVSVVNDSERSNSPRLAFGWILPLVSLHTMKSPGLFANQATPFEGMPCIISTTPATRLHNPGYFPRSASQAQGRRRTMRQTISTYIILILVIPEYEVNQSHAAFESEPG